MKTKVLSLILVLMLVFAFAAPASAYTDYGVVYDDTGLLNTDYLHTLSYDTLQNISDTYQFEVRVDIVQTLEGNTIEEYAEIFRSQYDYGVNGNGLLLMILVHQDDTGLAFDDYILYPYGSGVDIFSGSVMEELDATVGGCLYAEAFGGELSQDEVMIEAALTAYANTSSAALMDYDGDITAAAPVEEVAADEEVIMVAEGSGYTAVPGETPSRCVEDWAEILTEDELTELDTLAIETSAKYGCGIYILILNDYTTYNKDSLYEVATDWYANYGYGLGEGDDGIMLVLSMAERDYSLIVYGDSANYAFCDYAKDRLSETFLDNFSEDDWYGGFKDYISTAETYIKMAMTGTPMNEENDPDAGLSILVKLAIAVFLPLLIALIVCLVFRSQMKPVKKQTAAKDYLTAKTTYTDRSSVFSHTTETRTPLPQDDDYESGGGFSGKSGKF